MLGSPSQHPIGAVCGSAARTDLAEGRWVTIVPTGTNLPPIEGGRIYPDVNVMPGALKKICTSILRYLELINLSCVQYSISPFAFIIIPA